MLCKHFRDEVLNTRQVLTGQARQFTTFLLIDGTHGALSSQKVSAVALRTAMCTCHDGFVAIFWRRPDSFDVCSCWYMTISDFSCTAGACQLASGKHPAYHRTHFCKQGQTLKPQKTYESNSVALAQVDRTNRARTFWSLATTFLFSLLIASLCSCCSYNCRIHDQANSTTDIRETPQSQISYLYFPSVLIFPPVHVLNDAPHLLQLQCQKAALG